MKILVDQAELMKAFDIISECRNNLPGDGWVKEQLQLACNIIGPMWANGVDENKILVNKEIIEEAFHKVSWMANQKFPYKPGDGSDFDDVYRILQKILLDNHDPTKGKCLVCGRETNKTMSALDLNYCGPCWNSGKAAEYIEKEKEKPLTPITPEELMEIVKIRQKMHEDGIFNKPDPRCDGCEYQHPYLENMRLDELSNNVYCTRGSHPPYYKEGKTIQYDPALMLCQKLTNNSWVNPTNKPSDITDEDRKWADKEIEKHDDSQIPTRSKEKNIQAIKDAVAEDQRPVEFNPPCAEYCIPEVEKIMEREVSNHRAIIEILDMLIYTEADWIERNEYVGDTTLGSLARILKAKLVGEK